MATQKDVARLAGVSVSTVSRVLNDSSYVDKRTRKNVETAIKKLNYKPNLVAYGLRAKSSKLIGLILPELIHYAYASFAQYVEESCMKKGYTLLVGLHYNDCGRERLLIDEFQRRNVDGLIMHLAINGQNMSNNLAECLTVPTVLYEDSFVNNHLGNVAFNNYRAGVMAAEYLLSLNHKNLACTVGPMGMKYIRDRFWGFHDTLKANGIELKRENIFECDFNYQVPNFSSGEDAVRFFIDGRGEKEIPTAIWAHNDNVAIGIIKELHRKKIQIPEEISVMGMDNTALTDMIYPPLTTVGQPLRQMAEQSVKIVIKEMKQKGNGQIEIVMMEPELIVRESAGLCQK